MDIRKLHDIRTISLHFTSENNGFQSLPLPTEQVITGDFTIEFPFEGKQYAFGIDFGWKSDEMVAQHLYNFRTPRYTPEQLQVFQSLFEHLHLFPQDDENHYLGLADGRGLFTLTPFLLQTGQQQFLGYYLYEAGSDGESRGEPTPDRLFLGELIAVSIDEGALSEELFVG